ncbi:MAG: malonyl-CoA decarboxylase [Roseovarius sp.]|nr:malonyl-CoA decarboxylase [Roseovarius sp.]
MSVLADLLAALFERRYLAAGDPDPRNRSLEELARDLLGSSGEISGMALARHMLDRYAGLGDADKAAFFGFLARDLSLDAEALRAALQAFEAAPSRESYAAVMAAAEPPRQELARRLNQVPGATGQLVAMRADLLRLMREDPGLGVVDLDLRHLFSSWFNRGFLVLRPISWSSPADVLEKIIAYEAVHAIDSWDDLRRRLAPQDRRCFAFFHPAMPDEPLIFVEVALTRGIPGAIHDLLSEPRETIRAQEADTAVFYSISNCQPGLAGISFGNSLIKQVVADLAQELPDLGTFVTLSPIPGLARWLSETGRPLPEEPEARRAIAARYLLEARRADGTPFDPVARFHLGNGALIHAIHAGADRSANGLRQSGGVMVNYLYDRARIVRNHERFATTGQIAASPAVRALAASADKKTD